MIKLNHNNVIVRQVIQKLESEIMSTPDKIADVTMSKESDSVILVTLKYRGYQWTTKHCFNWCTLEYEYQCLEAVWQLDDCPNPIFEV